MVDYFKIFLGIVCLILAYFLNLYQKYSQNTPIPFFDENEFWGPGNIHDYKEDSSVYPFKIEFTNKNIQKLIYRLENAENFTEPLENVAFQYGFNTKKLEEIKNYWKDEYLPKWNKREVFLNSLPQFRTQIQGLKIHFIHAKPKVTKNVKVYPLLLLHGWPSSFRDFYDIIPMFTKASDGIAFEVIAPSLPGFGFSDGASKKGLGPEKMAIVLKNLMTRLKIDQFYVQGGDWGSIIGGNIAALFPENVLGFHSNFLIMRTPISMLKTAVASIYPSLFVKEIEKNYIDWIYPNKRHLLFFLQESGYFHLQATKPDTIGVALNHNPIGLAAYILEKFSTATNRDYREDFSGGLEKHFTYDSLIDNIMIYYMTNSMTTAARIYKEYFNPDKITLDRVAVTVPVGAAYFKNEIQHCFSFVLSERYKKIIHTSFFEEGGHFISLEMPKVLHEDVVKFVRSTL